MRMLASIALSFAAAVFAAVLLPWSGWTWWAAAAAGALGLLAVFLRRHLPEKLRLRAAVMLFSLCAGLVYYGGYQNLVQRPVLDRCRREAAFSATVENYGQLTERGAKVTVYLDGLRGAKAVCYGDASLAALEPGQRITGRAKWQDAGRIHENDVTTFTSRGVFALLYVQEDAAVEQGSAGSLRWLPQRMARAMREKIAAIWDDGTTAAFVTAELTGDRNGLSIEDETAMSQAGLSHLFAVSGLHCAFLVSLLGLLLGSRRRLFAGVSMAVLAFYMLMVGLSPSVVRACVMQAFVLAAPLFKRDSDGLTSLGAALLVILLGNPFAAGSISLQLSFAATLGLVWLSPKLYGAMSRVYTGKKRAIRWAVNFVCANVSASLAALIFTIPLTAVYFNILTLAAPVSNLLAVPAAGWNFMAGFVTVLVGFVWLPAARVLGWVCFGLVRYVLWAAGLLASGLMEKSGNHLFLDIGTNGEMALGGKDGFLCCAVASGPAFEGAGISCGMPGIDGAVSHVRWQSGFLWDVVGGGAPKGLCGSGLLDLAAVLLEREVITPGGRLLPPEEAPAEMRRWLERDAHGNGVFHLTPEVALTAEDVRALQLAKAAVAAGIQVLLERRGIAADKLDGIYLAGGFGNYLDPKSAVCIGMLPEACAGRLHSLGNSALAGASMLALDGRRWAEIGALTRSCQSITLSGNPDFNNAFAAHMPF